VIINTNLRSRARLLAGVVGPQPPALAVAEENLIRLHDQREKLRAMPRTMERARAESEIMRRLMSLMIALAKAQQLSGKLLKLKDERVARLVARIAARLPPIEQEKQEIVPGSEKLSDYDDDEFDDDPFVDEQLPDNDRLVAYLCGRVKTLDGRGPLGWREAGGDGDDGLAGDGEAVADEVEAGEAGD
jgi:hypothetical protein